MSPLHGPSFKWWAMDDGIHRPLMEMVSFPFFRYLIARMKKSTLQLLRFPFSFFLMPIFWFGLAMQSAITPWPAVLLFVVLHLLIYPSSNGYNSYMDRDTSSIGGLKAPPPPDVELYRVSIIMDLTAFCLSLFLGWMAAALIGIYLVSSRLYSYRGIRLKQYPIVGYLTVVLNQGALIFVLIALAVNPTAIASLSFLPVIAATGLIGGFYPLTQVYQHQSDKADNVQTISMRLGIRGTFVFCALIYTIAFSALFLYFKQEGRLPTFAWLQLFFLPVIFYFVYWAIAVWRDERKADFEHTMQMNWMASIFSNAAFITLLIVQHFG